VKLVSPELTQPSIVLACVGDDTGRSIENTLQLVGRLLWRTDQETATVVDPAGDECLDESSGRVVVERASDAAQLLKLKEAFGADRACVHVYRKLHSYDTSTVFCTHVLIVAALLNCARLDLHKLILSTCPNFAALNFPAIILSAPVQTIKPIRSGVMMHLRWHIMTLLFWIMQLGEPCTALVAHEMGHAGLTSAYTAVQVLIQPLGIAAQT